MMEPLQRNSAGIPVRPLGNIGVEVSIIGFGSGHDCRKHPSESQSVRLV